MASSLMGARYGSEHSAQTRPLGVVGIQGSTSRPAELTHAADEPSRCVCSRSVSVDTRRGQTSTAWREPSTSSLVLLPRRAPAHARYEIVLCRSAPGSASQDRRRESLCPGNGSRTTTAGAATLVLVPFFVRLDDLSLGRCCFEQFVAGAADPSACSNLHLSPKRHDPLVFHWLHSPFPLPLGVGEFDREDSFVWRSR